VVTLIERLIGKGYDVKLFDRDVSLAKLVGANKDYIEREIPHISKLMSDDIQEVVDHSEVLIIGNRNPAFETLFTDSTSDRIIIDLVRVPPDRTSDDHYVGICW
jgi:GDP-mannose 6-dehydrogenase